jgi:beta-lactamase class A
MEFETLSKKLNKELSKLNQYVGLKVKYLDSGQEFTHNEKKQFWAASLIKVPLACTVYKQVEEKKLDLAARYKIARENVVDGSGIAKLFDPGTEFTLHDLNVLNLTISDNSATNQLVDIVGWESVEKYMHELELNNTAFKHKMQIKAGRGPNLTTAEDMSLLLEMMYKDQIPGGHGLLEIMKHSGLRNRIPRFIPNEVLISRKPGSLYEGVHDVGIVHSKEPFIFCFLSDDQEDKTLTCLTVEYFKK